MSRIVAVDPGKYKCGLVLADIDRCLVIDGKVVLSSQVNQLIEDWQAFSVIDKIILGNGTTSNYWGQKLSLFSDIEVVDEKNTTLRARERYWELWPPSGLFAWLPRGLFLPPNNLDAVAALILLENYLGKELSWEGSHEFKI